MRITPEKADPAISKRGEPVTLQINDQLVQAFAGETVATVLLTQGQRAFRLTQKGQAPRGLFCGQGICFDCLVTVNGVADVRACITLVQPGMKIETGVPAVD